MQINVHIITHAYVSVDFLAYTIALISKPSPSCSSHAHHHRSEQFNPVKHTDSFINIDETKLIFWNKHTMYRSYRNKCVSEINLPGFHVELCE